MSLFAAPEDLAALRAHRREDPWLDHHLNRYLEHAERLSAQPGLLSHPASIHWWYAAFDRVVCVLGAQCMDPDPVKGDWLRDVVLDLVRRPLTDWVGPAFREHDTPEPLGHLETAHLSWTVALALDMGSGLFSSAEQEELRTYLRDRAVPLCRRWAEERNWRNNWAMILNAGHAMAAAVLGDPAEMRQTRDRHIDLQGFFEEDGSYAESLQYSSYAAFGLCLSHEALLRAGLDMPPPLPQGRAVRWWARGHLGMKPLPELGNGPVPRSVNFNDGALTFRPHGDVLAHLAARAPGPENRLARWMSDTCYPPDSWMPDQDRASFGFINQLSWLSFLLRPHAPAPLSPKAADLPRCTVNRAGEGFLRPDWNGPTVLAVSGSAGPCQVRNHQHPDAGSFVVSHRGERLLIDPGHCCYRSPLHGLCLETASHNTCTFDGKGQRPYAPAEERNPEGRLLFCKQRGPVCAAGFDLTVRYEAPLKTFQRIWLLAGAHVLFVVDRIQSHQPVEPVWHWQLNNRDHRLRASLASDGLRARVGDAALWCAPPPELRLTRDTDGVQHLAYHPQPGRPGEGIPGSIHRYRSHGGKGTSWTLCHTFILDRPAALADWRIQHASVDHTLQVTHPSAQWTLTLTGEELDLKGEYGFHHTFDRE